MRITLLKRAAMVDDFKNKRLSDITIYGKPTGAVCTVYTVGTASHFINGNNHDINDVLSKHLTELGITGVVIVHHKKMARGVSKWLNYNLTHLDIDTWKDDIIIYTLDQSKYESDLVEIRPTAVYNVDLESVGSVNDEMSRQTPNFDGMIVSANHETKGQVFYHLVPNRYIDGKIVALCGPEDGPLAGFVVSVNFQGMDHTVVIRRLPPWLTERDAEGKWQYLDKNCIVQYTSYTPGSRICNFSSPILFEIPGIQQ